MIIELNKVVTIDYTLTDTAGEILDSSEGTEPLSYIHGAGNIIPGLEAALAGKKVGDALKVAVEPKDGYGEYDKSLLFPIPRENFGENQIEIGMEFQAETEYGLQILTVVKIEGDEITVDANHPLAGAVLNFDVKIVDIREATEEELEHGHLHFHDHDGCGCGCGCGDDCDEDCEDGCGCEDGHCDC